MECQRRAMGDDEWSVKNQPQLWLNATGTAQPRALSVWMLNLACVSHVMHHVEGKGGGTETG